MSILIRIDRRTIRLNPDYGKSILYLEGRKRIEVFSPNPLPDRIAKHFYISSAFVCDDKIAYKDLVYEYKDGKKDIRKVFNFCDKNKHKGIVITIHHQPRIIDNSLAPKYYYKYRNPKLPCSECGELVKFNTIETHYGDEGHAFEECPKCHEINSFDYRLERISEAIKAELV